jgi:hypothetical protein
MGLSCWLGLQDTELRWRKILHLAQTSGFVGAGRAMGRVRGMNATLGGAGGANA